MSRNPIRPQTWIILVVALILVGTTWYLLSPAGTEAIATPTPTLSEVLLFPDQVGQLTSLTIVGIDGQELSVEQGDDSGTWLFTKPRLGTAQPGTVDIAVSQINNLLVLDHIDSGLGTSGIGLEPPNYVLTLGFSDGSSYTMEIGDPTPTDTAYYAHLENGDLVVISRSGVDSILRILASPPYVETETPTPEPATVTPAPTSTPAETATPEETPESVPTEAETQTPTS